MLQARKILIKNCLTLILNIEVILTQIVQKRKNLIMKNFFLLAFFFIFSYTANGQCWNIVWQDEFDGNSLENHWSYQTGNSGWGNNELQAYTNRVENSTVSNGKLQIIAREESYNGASYTSARLRSINAGDWTYGKFEASIKVPIGQGIWPAFWMMPTDSYYGGWPTSGEMDIMELLGHQPQISYGTAHWGTSPNNKDSSGSSVTKSSGNYSDEFHLFAIEWEPDQIRWYIDGVQFHTLNKSEIVAPFFWPFDQDFHFILNIAVGGNWPGSPDATTVFPQIMEVDYVRVYQLLNDVQISGAEQVAPNASGVIYEAPNINGAIYSWTVPDGANIVSGTDTHAITVDWNNASGPIAVQINSPCGQSTPSIDVYNTPNLTPNPGFEDDLSNWNTNAVNGAVSNFTIDQNNALFGEKSICAEVTSLGNNRWDVQLSPQSENLVAGENYKFSFWAKADANGKPITLAIINSMNYAYYGGNTFSLTDQWAYYEYFFTAPVTTNCLINFDLGDQTGTYCFDQYYFGVDAPLPAGLTDVQLDTNCIGLLSDINDELLVIKGDFSNYVIELLDGTGNVIATFNPSGNELLIETRLMGADWSLSIRHLTNGDVWVEGFN